MADPPFISDEPQQGAPLNAVASAFKWARDQIPQNPDAGISLANMARGGLESMGRWAQGVTDPSAITPSAIAAPAGAAAMTAPFVAAARGMSPTTLHGFIGPAQAARLDLTPGSRGSLGALERAQQTWAKGGTDSGALAETWAKHGWAPPEAFGTRGQPFTWQQLPDLRIRDDLMDYHREQMAAGGMATSEGRLADIMQPGADLDRLIKGTPALADADVGFRTAPGISYDGAAGVSAKHPGAAKLGDHDIIPPSNYFWGTGPDPTAAESIMIGHEIRGHGMPKHGDTQHVTLMEQDPAFRSPIYGTRAHDKISGERERFRKEFYDRYYSDPEWARSLEARAGTRWLDELRNEMPEQAARHAAYFAMPSERMARHAHILDQLERGGSSPFKEAHAPGVMSTYGPRSLVNPEVADQVLGAQGIYGMRDLTPPTQRASQRAPFDEMAD